MGVNEKGLAIVNSTSKDLPSAPAGYTNGALMRKALGYFATVQEFEDFLIATNTTGRKTQANFGLIDSTGAAVIFETSGKQYWKFNAANELQAPHSYIIRTNFSLTGGGSLGVERYRRTQDLMEQLYSENKLNYASIIRYHFRDFSDAQNQPVNIPFNSKWDELFPFGYINTSYSVCRYISISASVIRGVHSTEHPYLSTLWTALGQPACALTLPYWPVGNSAEESRGGSIAPLYKLSESIKSFLFDYPGNRDYLEWIRESVC